MERAVAAAGCLCQEGTQDLDPGCPMLLGFWGWVGGGTLRSQLERMGQEEGGRQGGSKKGRKGEREEGEGGPAPPIGLEEAGSRGQGQG